MTPLLHQKKPVIFYLHEIFQKLNDLNISLQRQSINIVRARHLIRAFVNKLVLWKLQIEDHNFQQFANLKAVVVDNDLHKYIIRHLSFLHENFNIRFEDLLALNIPIFVGSLHTMTMNDILIQPECVQMALCEATVNDNLRKSSENN
ncbi:general transcription factor II-I repeat domain-containing protein 2B-like [Octopus bimaculoides]|uniref:general transcription factor II-I repeat domain-containing protein 2B-like n=1 Tax=Octopus bimaculoides TaxID=37653 RepID=UPI00071C57A8|nr:general transcription factor II-I repeat domain-containing protein 2B-like [Octopus bimaculoides]|eukprot:XP_014788752.1 PREDICTED: general transcription factor II-I repeat domain-containing protein 2B-like [Octopus bimaculoides]